MGRRECGKPSSAACDVLRGPEGLRCCGCRLESVYGGLETILQSGRWDRNSAQAQHVHALWRCCRPLASLSIPGAVAGQHSRGYGQTQVQTI